MPIQTNAGIEKEFDYLKDQVIFLYFEWQQFESLFGKSEARVAEVLNATAENFFYCVERVFADHFAISLYRLLDIRNDVSSVKRFVARLNDVNDPSDLSEIAECVAEIGKLMPPIQKWRHNVAAHLNKNVALGLETIPGYSRDAVNQILGYIDRLLNVYGVAVRDNHYVLDHIGNVHFDAEYLVYTLKKSLLYDQAVNEGRIDRREFDQSDYASL